MQRRKDHKLPAYVSSPKVFLILDVLSSLFKTKPVHVPSETARNPDQLAFAKQTARVRGLSVHLGGPKTFFKNINFCIFGFSGDFGCPWVILAHVGCLFSTHGRPCVSVSTHRTSVAVRQHTQDVRGRPSAHTGRPAVHQYTYQHAPWTVRDIRQHTQDVRGCPCVSVCPSVHTGRPSAHTGRPSAHAGRPWLSVCVRVSVSAHRTSVSTHRTSVSTRRTSVSTRRTSVAVRVCPCVRQCTQDVRQHTQDVRQHTQDVRQHTQDVRGCPCVSVCPSAHAGRPSVHTGRPSAHKGRPWPCVSTQRTSVAVRQHTQDVRQYTEDVPGRPSAHTGRPSAHAGHPCVSVCPSVHTGRPSAHTGRPSVHTGCPSAHTGRPWSSVSTHISMLALPVDCSGDFSPRGLSVQYTQDVRQHTQDVCACPLAHTDCPWTDPCTELISAC
ncbi:hypothetical protein IGI04_043076 [Brassica rapa subsp. trilocularis]|uniref:Uncharacterized protein n=1 Tax=Brassica rapa subsp. trilocularis TaxID=1813537 RepID=A0ABQ7KID1_BRACM|nr:hypothetical protein IGI04_043076 [Brassica rapa subsp. trilocularis]